jgi:hypothetical protein
MGPRLLLLIGGFLAGPRDDPQDQGSRAGELRLDARAGALDLSGEGLAFLELVTPSDELYVGQEVPLRLRIGLEQTFLAENLLQLFARTLDVPVQLEAAWLEELPGARLLPGPHGADPGAERSFVLNERVVRAPSREQLRVGGRRFTVLELERTLVPLRAGELALPESRLHFAYATRFEDDFVHGRVARDRSSAFVRGPGRELTIRALPEEGRPAGFGGAVGRFTLRAAASAREVRVGESFRLELVIAGSGNLEHFPAPALDLAGFHVNGLIEELRGSERAITYDLEARQPDLAAIPPIALEYFDPDPPAGYRSARTPPIPLRVLPATGSGPALEPQAAPHRGRPLLLGSLALVLTVLLLGVVRRLQRRRSPRPAE